MEKIKILESIDEIKAFSDPYRLQILSTFKRIGRPATVTQIGDAMKEVPAKIHYHVKKMEKAGVLRLAHTEEINGIIAKYYEPTAESFSIRSKELDPGISKLVLNETQKVISSVYDHSKKMILKELENAVTTPDESSVQVIRPITTYITDDKAMELEKYIENFFIENGKKESEANNDKQLRKYHVFTAIFPIENEKE